MLELREPRPDPRQELGRLGEAEAEAALYRDGLRVIERRFRCRLGEIDLIALHGDVIVFVEVKTRRGDGYGRPAEAVHARKRASIAAVALEFLRRRRWLERVCRFDVVEVRFGSVGARTSRLEDAFRL